MRSLAMKPETPVDSPQTPAPSSSTAKRKKQFDDADANGSSKKKARTRVSYSCSECHRRKQKCDRQIPCGHCVARKVPELCKGYTPGKSENDLHLRLTRLEQIIEMALPQFSAMSPSGDPSHAMGEQPCSRSRSSTPDEEAKGQEQHEPSGGILQSGKFYGTSALGSVSSAPILEPLQHTSLAGLDEPSASDMLKSLVQEYGVAPHKISELVQELPPRRLADVLVDYYFTSINYTRYPIDEAAFRRSYESVCNNGVQVLPNDVRFLPLLFVVLAIAGRLAPEHIAGDDRTRRLTSLRYYWSSRRSMLIAAAIQNDALELVLARLLSARFLTFDRRITECWSQLGAAVRSAQAIGLHRDGSKLKLDPYQTEYRRRIWAYLYHADRTHALLMGRPHAIQDEYTSTLPPLNVEDKALLSPPIIGHPLSTPTPMTFCILRHSLATIMGHIVHHFQQVRSPSHYSEVIALDEELQRFLATLPPHYALDPDTSLDMQFKYIPVHRFLIITEAYFVRISLHRPYLLRKLDSDKYLPSRRACFEAAKQDFRVRQSFKRTASQDVITSLGGAYREFQAAMISGIALVLDPNGPESHHMHMILDGFLNDNAGIRDLDETTRRELRIIELLKSKASSGGLGKRRKPNSGDEATSPHMSPRGSGFIPHPGSVVLDPALEQTHNASLLLGLGQSGSSFPSPSSQLRSSLEGASHSSPAGRQPYLSLTLPPSSHFPSAGSNPPTHPSTPTSPFGNRGLRRRRSNTGRSLAENSVAGSSPSGEDESAQRLLDHWVQNVVHGSGIAGESSHYDLGGTLRWGSDAANSMDTPTFVGSPEQTMPVGAVAEGADWTYWEQLVSQIQIRGGGGLS